MPIPDDSTSSGSLRDYLSSTPEGNRNRILRAAIGGEGFNCQEVKSASLVHASGGSAWRTNCGDAQVYWIEVDEFGGFTVVPMPYGDIDVSLAPGSFTAPVQSPPPESRTPEPPVQRRLERNLPQ